MASNVSAAERASAGPRPKHALAVAGWLGAATFMLTGGAPAQDADTPDFSGVWSTNSVDTLENPWWDIVGAFSCRCAAESYDVLDQLLNDPANDGMNAEQIVDTLAAHTREVIAARLTDHGRMVGERFDLADDPAIQCERFNAFRTVLHSDPITFEKLGDRIIIRGEDLTVDRTVWMDGRAHPDTIDGPAGHSIGWYEGDTLVVETVNVPPGLVDDQLAIHSSDQARSIERYRITHDGHQLYADFTLYDPVMLEAPLTIVRPRVLTPDVELDRAPCEAIAGQF
jgi:hypothetical protein